MGAFGRLSSVCAENEMNIELVHQTRGTICSYVLKLQADGDADYYIYCGSTADVEVRFAQHSQGTASQWTKLHPPTELLSIKIHESEREAMMAEVAN